MKKRKKKTLYIIALVLLLGTLTWVHVNHQKNTTSPQAEPGWGDVAFDGDVGTDSESNQMPQTAEVIDTTQWKTFENTSYNISFNYPPEYNVGILQEEGVETIVVQNAGQKQGFQIVITPLDEQFDITEARIRRDIPDMEIRNPQSVILGENIGQGLAFISDNEAFAGNSREVWFVFNKKLYQVSTYASLDSLLQTVMGTWEFK